MSTTRDTFLLPGITASAIISVAITPADSNLANGIARALYIGGAGNVTIMNQDGSTCQFVGVPAGTILPVMARQVRAATTATSIVALF